MKLRIAAVALTTLVGTMLTLYVAQAAEPTVGPPGGADKAIPVPGITGTDTRPQGCVSCHTGEHTIDRMLAALKHRKIDDKVKVVPNDCKTCHKPGGDIDPLAQMIHMAHYGDGPDSEFVTHHGGLCLNCHALDRYTGEVTVKSGPKNW